MAKTRTARTGEVERQKREMELERGKKLCLFSGGNIFDQFS